MSLEGLLTFLALAVAIYAVVPLVVKLRAKLGRALQIPLALGASVLVLYLLFFDVLGQTCPSMIATICNFVTFPADGSFTAAEAAFLAVIGWMLLAWVVNWIAWRTSASLPTLSRLVDEVIFEQRFAEVLKLVGPHLPLVQQAARRKLPLQRLHDRLLVLGGGGTIEQMLAELDRRRVLGVADDDDNHRHPLFEKLRHWIGKLAILTPAQSRAETAAKDIARVLFRSPDLGRFVARMRPYFGIQLLRLDLYGNRDFSDAFFGDLISDAGSVLYQELKQNQGHVPPSGVAG